MMRNHRLKAELLSRKLTMRQLDIRNALTPEIIRIVKEYVTEMEKSTMIFLYDLFNFINYKNIIKFMTTQQSDYQEYDNGLILKSKNFIAVKDKDNSTEDCYYIHLILEGGGNRYTYNIDRKSIHSIEDYESRIESLLYRVFLTGNFYNLKDLSIKYIKWLYYTDDLIVPTIMLKDEDSGNIVSIKRLLFNKYDIKSFLEKIMDEDGLVYDKL